MLRLDDTAIEAQMNIRGLKKSKRIIILNGLMAMEGAALDILNQNSDKP